MKCALIINQVVHEIADLDENGIHEAWKRADLVIAIEGLDPLPAVGWHYVNNVFSDPDALGNGGVALLTKFAFFNRFTIDEVTALEGFMDAGPSPYKYTARALKTSLMVATYIDRSWPEVISGLDFLVMMQVLTQARRDEIMNQPAQSDEIYRGK